MDEVYMVMEYVEQVGDPTPRVVTRGTAKAWHTWLAYFPSSLGAKGVPVGSRLGSCKYAR